MARINLARYAFIVVILFFFITPFFWLKSGEIDVGGDGSRLYFYDPGSYLTTIGLFSVDPQGVGKIVPNQHFIPLLSLMQLIYKAYYSPHLAVTVEKSIKLTLSFVFIYLIVKELFPHKLRRKNSISIEASAILAGVFYALSPSMTDNIKNALPTHNLIFLNPMLFYLLFKYCLTKNKLFLWISLTMSLIFATNFSIETPAPFSFYPLALPFLFIYVGKIMHKQVPWKMLIVAGVFALGLHAFHLIPVLSNVLDSNSYLHTRVFESSEKGNPGLSYFDAVRPMSKISNYLLLPRENKLLLVFSFIPLLISIVSLLINKNKAFLIVILFFISSLYLVGANITQLGIELYRILFSIPGFGMFRNFSGQWQFVYTFFYALTLGVSSGLLFAKLRKKYFIVVFIFAFFYFVTRSWSFINGQVINFVYDFSNGVHATIRMDQKYEQTLSYVKSLPADGKVLTLPLSDFYMQVLHGTNNGAYIGLSSISFLAGRNDFAAYQILYPFPEILMRLSREKKYDDIKNLLSILNIRYIFHNSDPLIYDISFSGFPYSYLRQSLPNTQKGYAEFIEHLTVKKIYDNDPYKIYETDLNYYNPLFYIPSKILVYKDDRNDWYGRNESFFEGTGVSNQGNIFITDEACRKLLKTGCNEKEITESSEVKITYIKINPTKYKLNITNAHKPFLLVFSNDFNDNWKVYNSENEAKFIKPFDNILNLAEKIYVSVFSDPHIFETLRMKPVSENLHVSANGYANVWKIDKDTLKDGDVQLIVEAKAQRVFYLSSLLSLISLVIFVAWIIYYISKQQAK